MEARALESGRIRAREGEDAGLSPRTVLHLHRVLRSALQQAVRWQLLPRNPVDAVKPPRVERKEMKVLDEAETARLLEVAKGGPLYLPVVLAVTMGMRRGEILGLRRVDVNGSVLSVRQTLTVTKQGLRFGEPKTAKSRRTIALLPMTVEALNQHQRTQARERLRLGPVYDDQGLVCAGSRGAPWHPSDFTKSWRALAREHGFDIRFHDLRHTHASQLLRQGVHPKVVSERLGHSSVGLTLDIYSHVLPNIQEEAVLKLEGALTEAIAAREKGAN